MTVTFYSFFNIWMIFWLSKWYFIFLAFSCHTCWLKNRGGHHTIKSHKKKISSEAPMVDFVWQLDMGSVKIIPCDVINLRQNIRNALLLWGITSFFEKVPTSWTNPNVKFVKNRISTKLSYFSLNLMDYNKCIVDIHCTCD